MNMKLLSSMAVALVFTAVFATTPAGAQQTAPPPYGTPIGLEVAKKLAVAAEAEATKNNWSMAIAILDSTGHVVLVHRLDNTMYGAIAVAEDKARTALDYKRPTKAFEDVVAQGGQDSEYSLCVAQCRSKVVCRSYRTEKLSEPLAFPEAALRRMGKWPRLAQTR